MPIGSPYIMPNDMGAGGRLRMAVVAGVAASGHVVIPDMQAHDTVVAMAVITGVPASGGELPLDPDQMHTEDGGFYTLTPAGDGGTLLVLWLDAG